MRIVSRSTAAFGIVFVAVQACASGSREGVPGDARPSVACGPVTRSIASNAPVTLAEALAGAYRLTMVRTSGDSASADGRLTLAPQVDSLRPMPMPDRAPEPRPTIPLIGTAEIDLEAVGAHRLGDLASEDPMRPGVIVVHRPGEITMRFGSDVNIREMPAFDGGYMAFFVARVDRDGFSGGWSSGVQGRDAEGYFCAVRVTD